MNGKILCTSYLEYLRIHLNLKTTGVNNLAMSLLNSKFRTSFKLKQKDIDYIQEKGLDTIRAHAADFIAKREAPAVIPNDGKQTPTKGHPVFIAQHATAT